jgi:ech hydrogenase subunit F
MANPFNLPMVGRTLRNLVSKPATRRYPFEVGIPFEGSRGMLDFDPGTCVLCGICARRCPAAAITCDRETRLFAIDQLLCVTCGVCVDACNKNSLHLAVTRRPVQVPADAGPAGGRPGRESWTLAEPAPVSRPAPAAAIAPARAAAVAPASAVAAPAPAIAPAPAAGG